MAQALCPPPYQRVQSRLASTGVAPILGALPPRSPASWGLGCRRWAAGLPSGGAAPSPALGLPVDRALCAAPDEGLDAGQVGCYIDTLMRLGFDGMLMAH